MPGGRSSVFPRPQLTKVIFVFRKSILKYFCKYTGIQKKLKVGKDQEKVQSEKNSTLHKTLQKTNATDLPAKYWSSFIKVVINRLAAHEALPGGLRIQEEGLFIVRDLRRRVIYFPGFWEKK